MLGPERFLPDGESSLVERLRLLVSPLRIVESCQVVEARSSIGMLGPERPLVDGESSLEKQLRLLILSPLLQVIACLTHHPDGFLELEAILINECYERLRVRNQLMAQRPVGVFDVGKDRIHSPNSALRPHSPGIVAHLISERLLRQAVKIHGLRLRISLE